jgi:uncharacterized membrane protein (DUF485 family)
MSAAVEPDWAALARSPEFRELMATKRRFIVAGTCFYCAYFLAFLCLLGFAPGTMNNKVAGNVTLALVLGMSLVVLAVTMAFLYKSRADRWDRLTERVVAAAQAEPRFTKDATREESLR